MWGEKMKQCILCFQEIAYHQDIFHWLKEDQYLCGECMSKFHMIDQLCNCGLFQLHALYQYDEFLENLLFQYKEGRDVALAPVFFHEVKRRIEKQYKGYTLCLCPSSKEKTKERGFHALSDMLDEIHLPKLQPFLKLSARKQSTLHFDERQSIASHIALDKNVKLPDHILLIDDVCTTGATLKACYQLLQPYHKTVKVMALCVHPLLLNSHNSTSCAYK